METDLHPQQHKAFWLRRQNWVLFNFSKIRRFADKNCQISSKNFSVTLPCTWKMLKQSSPNSSLIAWGCADERHYSGSRCIVIHSNNKQQKYFSMKPFSMDLRKKIVIAHLVENISIRKVAAKFSVSKSLVQKLVKQQRVDGNLQPKQRGKPQFSHLKNAEPYLRIMVAENPDATLLEFCELFAAHTGNWVSRSAMSLSLQKLGLNRKKKTMRSSQSETERVQKLRVDYWEKVKDIDPVNLVFLDETGVMLGLARTHARSKKGTRVYDLKPFYRGAKVTAIGAISIKKILALMTMDNSMDGKAFEVFVEKFLVPELWSGAVVIMDNLSAHKRASITTMIESVGAKIICLSPYSPDFNPIELWWSQLKSFLRSFSPTTTEMVDTIIAVALKLMNPQHLRNWFANCCYCTS